MTEFQEDLRFFAGIAAFIIGTFAAILLLAFWLSSKSCYGAWENSGFEVDWGIWSDCRIKIDGKWIPTSRYIVNHPRPQQ